MDESTAPVRIRGKISETDYLRGQWLHYRPRPWLAAIGALLLLAMVWAVVTAIQGWLQGTRSAESAGLALFAAVFLSVWLGMMPWRFRRAYRGHKMIQEPVALTISDEGVRLEEAGSKLVGWNLYIGYRAGEQALLIYQSRSLFHLLARPLFESDAEFERAVEIAGRHLKRI